MDLPFPDIGAASLGRYSERFSVRLIQSPIHAEARNYIDEYTEVSKEEPQTGKLTRFIMSEPVTFGIEITLKPGFTYGSYDGVQVTLSSSHSRSMIWKKKFPKTSQKGAKTIIINSIYTIVDGQLTTNVNFGLDLLTDVLLEYPSSSVDMSMIR
ncbi:hypothetical protein CJF30_00006742 [Rutstroemia sp. NJR-2017a BBW]|nr:hypothetical protein CJF30_00006742 [Rutstroemia sp. NJR-2017a BBW]